MDKIVVLKKNVLATPSKLQAALAVLLVVTVWLMTGGAPVFIRVAALGSALALPFLMPAAWSNFLPFFWGQHKLWLPPSKAPEHKAVLFLGSLPLGIRLARPFPNGISEAYPLIAPNSMALGDVFYHFLQDGAEQKKNLPPGKLAWSFHTVRPGRPPRYLDPELTLSENGLSANAVITASPVVVTRTLPSSPKNKRLPL